MSDHVLKEVMESLGPYRMQESQIKIRPESLGNGAFGDVKLGEIKKSLWSSKPSVLVAVKQLRVHESMTPEEKKKLLVAFARELVAWAGLDHPHVVPLRGFCLDEKAGTAWLISPYFKNGNIRVYLDKMKPDWRTRIRLFGESAKGLVYLHERNIRHGDIKSGNVLVDDDGHAKLCDFGLAKYMEGGTSGLTTSNNFQGSVPFMAPEFYDAEHPHSTKKSDNWAWCCLGLEILFDEVPYKTVKRKEAIMGQIMKGVLPATIEDFNMTEDIKSLFTGCWVSEPENRIEMTICSKVLADALLKLPLISGGNDASTSPEGLSHQIPNRSSNELLQLLAPYRIDEKRIVLMGKTLGRGGFGVVVLGEMDRSFWNAKSGTLVAVKQIQKTEAWEAEKMVSQALVKEAHVWAGLSHPHILSFIGFVLNEKMNMAWLVSPYMKNGSITMYLKQHNTDLPSRLCMWRDVASGIAYMHDRNLCHGGIKGGDVLVDDAGHVKICDFGLTTLVGYGSTTSAGLRGTTRYMAPELFSDAQTFMSEKRDVWAWGCFGLEVLFDRIPYEDAGFEMKVITQIIKGVPPLDLSNVVVEESIKQIFKQCWVVEPLERIDIKACENALEAVLHIMQQETDGKPKSDTPQ